MKVHIISGFLGSGKTTFLNKYLPLLKGKVVVIENEFGDISVDTNLIEKDIPVHEIYAGCICCTLAGNFQRGIKEIADKFSPDHIVIEPSGVGKLSDVINACYLAQRVERIDLEIERLIVLVDAESCRDFLEDFGEFYSNQIEHAKLILLSHLHMIDEIEKTAVVDILKEKNRDALIYDADWRVLGEQALLELVELSEDYGKIKFKIDKGNIPADKVFSSLVIDVSEDIGKEKLELALNTIKEEKFGIIRAKGVVNTKDGFFLIQYTNGKIEIIKKKNKGKREYNQLVFIGCNIEEERIRNLFDIN